MPPLPFPVPTILLDSIAAAATLIYFPFLIVAFGRTQVGYSTSAPRAVFDKLPAFAQRATWAHQNSFETFMGFAAAALTAYVTEIDSTLAGWAAIAFVTARFFYSVFYITNIPLGRSLMFGIGTLSTVTLFVLSLSKVHSLL
ncbi:MAG: MAPEG family protein [Scytolyngbya sp. HA4215-MV1]|jgi:uncharacterized MAPEG superfamily protein|nr:MAPEG family protein [Scytolyngbya sp. HA4215-MV1]